MSSKPELFQRCCSLLSTRQALFRQRKEAYMPRFHYHMPSSPGSVLKTYLHAQPTRKRILTQRPYWPAQRCNYASIGGTICLQIEDALCCMASPQKLAGCRNVQLILSDWPKWSQDTTVHDSKLHSRLSHVLGVLESNPHVDSVFLTLSDVLKLPLESRKHPDHQERTPVTILGSIAVDVKPIDLGVWALPDYLSIKIGDPAVIRLVQEARKYTEDANAWHDVVGRSGPTYQAFDYTASFHAIDLRIRSEGTSEGMRLVDFGPYGSEYSTEDLDILSIYFADDMAHNTEYFERGNKWIPNLYELLRHNHGFVSSKLGYRIADGDGSELLT